MIWSHPAFRLFANSVVAISTWGPDHPNAMSAEWCTPASIDPVLLAVLIGNTRFTEELLRDCQDVAISLFSEDHASLAHHLGDSSGRDGNKLSEASLWFPGPKRGLPLIKGAAAHFECQITDRYPVGDHIMMIVSPVWASAQDNARPLVYHRGRYHRLDPINKPPN